MMRQGNAHSRRRRSSNTFRASAALVLSLALLAQATPAYAHNPFTTLDVRYPGFAARQWSFKSVHIFNGCVEGGDSTPCSSGFRFQGSFGCPDLSERMASIGHGREEPHPPLAQQYLRRSDLPFQLSVRTPEVHDADAWEGRPGSQWGLGLDGVLLQPRKNGNLLTFMDGPWPLTG